MTRNNVSHKVKNRIKEGSGEQKNRPSIFQINSKPYHIKINLLYTPTAPYPQREKLNQNLQKKNVNSP